jgi:hypothetical protein
MFDLRRNLIVRRRAKDEGGKPLDRASAPTWPLQRSPILY